MPTVLVGVEAFSAKQGGQRKMTQPTRVSISRKPDPNCRNKIIQPTAPHRDRYENVDLPLVKMIWLVTSSNLFPLSPGDIIVP